MVSAPWPGAGIDRPALSLLIGQRQGKAEELKTHVDVDVKAIIPRIGAPSSRAVLALMTT
jgi:hypothetical protein